MHIVGFGSTQWSSLNRIVQAVFLEIEFQMIFWGQNPPRTDTTTERCGIIGLYRDVWIAAIASSTTSLATRTAAICVRFQGRRVRRAYVTMQITFLTRKSALIYRRGLRQRVASLTLNCNGDFAIRAYSMILTQLHKSKSEVVIAGDFNFDMLKLNENNIVSNSFDIITSQMFHPTITRPTRFSDKRCTLLDTFYCK